MMNDEQQACHTASAAEVILLSPATIYFQKGLNSIRPAAVPVCCLA